ncbi:GNAT family N-acetyltransferase [Rubinisphaera margarita]|uniref:GNAT family N-acetyltransferase n=1 Tax=Rubinisphaera margarita TaxID=2909586 RepID=UPI001EE81F42|nr:GNAT family N-acetyltransferase [Rubinisphaera margarita]MCG6157456.1 GNAT family N-acetyltransferase [Rubinisphaera margarita]
MSIEIRTYEGTAEDLSRFIVGAWLQSYGGKMAVPDWSAEYFEWQMTGPGICREFLISAWKDEKIVGTLLAMPFRLWCLGEETQGDQGSWLTVLPEHRRDGVAKAMAMEVARREANHGCTGRVGYAFRGSRISMGPRFWKKAGKRTNFLRPVFLWARLLESRSVREWTNSGLDRTLLKVLPDSVCNIGKVDARVTIRDFQPEDVSRCCELINTQARKADLAVLWEESRLARQLHYSDFVNTMVVERDGQVVGFVNYHKIGMHLKTRIPAAIIDLLACQDLSPRETRSLLNALCLRLRDEGVKMMLMREFHGQPTGSLLRTRFIPQFVDSDLLFSTPDPESQVDLGRIRKIHVLWR